MVAATARRAVLPALLALAALLALPNAAGAALQLGLVRRLPRRPCATLNVPLDRAGVDPGHDRPAHRPRRQDAPARR